MKRTVMLSIMLVAAAMLLPINSYAQKWKMGVTIGGDNNTYNIDTQYQYDWRYHDVKGLTVGLMGQYQMTEWFALRADLNYTQKNFKQYRTGLASPQNYTHHNSYLQLPVMASFSFGGERLRGFLNMGVYGAYWTASNLSGTVPEEIEHDILDMGMYYKPAPVDQDYVFNSVRDNRMEFGTVSGVGAEYRFNDHWALQAELRMYYSLTSTTKNYMIKRNPRYNTTTALQLGCAYSF